MLLEQSVLNGLIQPRDPDRVRVEQILDEMEMSHTIHSREWEDLEVELSDRFYNILFRKIDMKVVEHYTHSYNGIVQVVGGKEELSRRGVE